MLRRNTVHWYCSCWKLMSFFLNKIRKQQYEVEALIVNNLSGGFLMPGFVPSSTLPKTCSLTQNSWHVWLVVQCCKRTCCCAPNLDSWPKFKAAICPSQHRHLPELTRSDSLEFGGSQDTSTVWWNCGKKGVWLKCFVGMMLTCSRWMCCSCSGKMKFKSAHILKADKSNVCKVVCLQKNKNNKHTAAPIA